MVDCCWTNHIKQREMGCGDAPPVECWSAPYDDELGQNDYSTLSAGNGSTTWNPDYIGEYTTGAWESTSSVVAVDTVTIPCALEGCEQSSNYFAIRFYNPSSGNVTIRVTPEAGGSVLENTASYAAGEVQPWFVLDGDPPWTGGALIEVEKAGAKIIRVNISCGIG